MRDLLSTFAVMLQQGRGNLGSCTAGLMLLWPPIFTPRVRVPLYADPCAAGFPSPAQDYVEKVRHEVA